MTGWESFSVLFPGTTKLKNDSNLENWNFVRDAFCNKTTPLPGRSFRDFTMKLFLSLFHCLLFSSRSFCCQREKFLMALDAQQIFIWYDIPSGSIFGLERVERSERKSRNNHEGSFSLSLYCMKLSPQTAHLLDLILSGMQLCIKLKTSVKAKRIKHGG